MRKINLLTRNKFLTSNAVTFQQFKRISKDENDEKHTKIQSFIALYSFIYSTLITIGIMLLTVNSGFGFVIFVSNIKNNFLYSAYFIEAFNFSFLIFILAVGGVINTKIKIIGIIYKNSLNIHIIYKVYKNKFKIILLFFILSIGTSLLLFIIGFNKVKSMHEVFLL